MNADREDTKTILVVEDNAINRELVYLFLTKRGYKVESAKNGAQAIQLVKSTPFDLIIMDVSMPDIDGCTATTRIRKYEEETHSHHTPIVALTAHTSNEVRRSCLAAGMDDVLVKPLRATEFFKAVDKFVN